ncbi:helix-turn-helix domain-containing protein (plasmid) [Bacillus carboniphilus]|uniref:Helix-turn-helix domain-containing protein n=1 Tax=Bacillus carboniphilus TaxID=86663 RepID=A0ABY9K3N9_9BACI|nr:helix-turn-helix domain-containing protein [Bacillus carboniphilus]WLR44521.1 helix-turn-helix domain-containing protein [Bacillus carboniphilus]
MSIIRVVKNRDFVVMNKTSLDDPNLSWKAKGLHAYMLSKPDDWTFYNSELQKHAKDGRDSFKSALKELREAGYVVRKRAQNEEGKFDGWETIVYEFPQPVEKQDEQNEPNPPKDGKSVSRKNRHRETRQSENPQLLSIDSTKYLKELNNDLSNYIYSVLEHWNSKGIIKHKKLNKKMESHIKARLEEYSLEEVLKAIDHYAEVLHSQDHYWTHRWTLQDFMKPNNMVKFLDESNPIETYRTKKQKQSYQPQHQFQNGALFEQGEESKRRQAELKPLTPEEMERLRQAEEELPF